MSWLPVAGVNEIQPGDYRQVDAGITFLLICNVHGEYFAIEDRCTHDDASLAGGCLTGDQFVCPRHGATFCVRDGAVTAPPAYEPLQTFPVRLNGNNIEVEIDA